MKTMRFLPMVLALSLVVAATGGASARGKPAKPIGHKTLNAAARRCPASASTATFTDAFGTGKAAFKTQGACISFMTRDLGVANVSLTATPTFRPHTAIPSGTKSLRVRGTSLAARVACPTAHNSTVAFTNSGLTVNGKAVSMNGQTVTVSQLSASPTIMLTGTHAFKTHGMCVSFFARNNHLLILTLM